MFSIRSFSFFMSTFCIFFVISKLIERLSEKYVSYLSDVSPARSSHANRTEDSLAPFPSSSPRVVRVRASMQNTLISPPVYRPTGWKYYLGSVPRRTRTVLYRELIYCQRASENITPLVKRSAAGKGGDRDCNYGRRRRVGSREHR